MLSEGPCHALGGPYHALRGLCHALRGLCHALRGLYHALRGPYRPTMLSEVPFIGISFKMIPAEGLFEIIITSVHR